MKRILFMALFVGLFAATAAAQLPPGSPAPNWTMSDINGVSHTLSNYLDQDKVVFLDFSATWCGPCWNYHNTGALENLYDQYGPPGSNNVMVFMVEGDEDTNTACLYGPTGCNGGTQGNWVSGTPYPIIDNHTQNGPYQISYFPTIYGVCPDNTVTEVGQVNTATLWNFAKGCSAPTASIANVTGVDCFGGTGGSIELNLAGGMPPFTFQWSNGQSTQNLYNLPAGNYTLTVTGSLGGTKTFGPVTIEQPSAELQVSVSNVVNAGCGGLGGSIELTAFGGTPGYSYAWSNGETSPSISSLQPGNYSLTVTDANNCTYAHPAITIEPPVQPVAVATAPFVLTCNSPSMTLSGAGTTLGPEYSYVWTTTTGQIISGANTLNNCVVGQPGSYELFVFNTQTNCSATATTLVSANQTPPTASAGGPGVLTCTANQVQLAGSGSTGSNFNILWTTQGGNIVSGATTFNPTVNQGGTYTMTITNSANGCTESSSTTVLANTAQPNVSANGGQVTCSSSSVQLAGNSTTPGVTYAWTGPGGFTSTAQNPTVSTQGTYILTVTNPSNNCTATDDAEVQANTAPPQASAQGGTINCSNASVTLSGSSTTPGVTYEWTGPNNFTANSQNPVVSEQGNYILTVTAPNGCDETATAIVNLNTTAPTANAGSNGLLNCNNATVVLNGAASSAGPQYTYLWTTADGNIESGATTLSPTVTAAGTYTLQVLNTNNGCEAEGSTIVTQSPPVVADISAQANVGCFGEANGTATMQASGGTGSFTYAWSNGSSTATAENLSAGTYSVTATDGEGCAATETIVITEPALLVVNASTTAQTMPGVNDGTASAAPTGGAGSYTYAWSNGSNTATIDNLPPGNYTVSVTDANGCVKTQTVTVNVFGCAVSATATATNASCNGANDGTASIALGNAAGTVVYNWSNGENTQSIGGLSPDTYSVTATDGNGCEVVASVEVSEPAGLNANTTATGVTAQGADDGTATANPTGGTAPFTYAWSNGGASQAITGLASNNYTVTVTDVNGCVDIQTVAVAPFNCAVLASVVANNISCFGANDGQATAFINSNLTPFTYAWSNGASTATVSNLGAGTYTVSVSDAANCATIAEVTIDEPNTLSLELTEFADADCGVANGLATVVAMGGTQGYSYVWSNGANTAGVSNLDPGTYTVSVSDANACQSVLSVAISINDSEAPAVAVQNLTLALNADGAASLSASQVDNGSVDNCGIASMSIDVASFSCGDLGDHPVTLTVTDEAGNSSTATATVTVVDNTPPTVAVQSFAISLGVNGTASITPETVNFGSFDNCGISELSLDVTTFTCNDIGQQPVVLKVTDASGNTSTGTAIITVEDNIAPSITCPESMVLAYCDPVATFEVAASDNCAQGLAPTQTSGLPSGATFPDGITTMAFEVNDGHGNHSTCTFTVEVPVAMELSLTTDEISCFGENDGSVSAQAAGGAAGYSYLWSNGATTPAIENLGAGDYKVTVTDATGCQIVQSASLAEPTAIFSNADAITPETIGQQNGSIEVTVTGGTQPYAFEWTNAAGAVVGNDEDLDGIGAGNYTLEVTDDNGCVALHVFTVQSVSGVSQKLLEQSVNLYPNPTAGSVTVALDGIFTQTASIQIFDVTGKLAATFPGADLSSGAFQMDVSSQADGVYLVRILIENGVVTKRLVVSK